MRKTVQTWLGDGIAAHEIGVFVPTPQFVTRTRAAIDGLAGVDGITTAPMNLAKGAGISRRRLMACDEGILPLDARVADAADEEELDEI